MSHRLAALFAQPSYSRIVTAAATTFIALFLGAGGLSLHCQLLEVEVKGFERTMCEGPIEPIALLLILIAPVGTTFAGLLSREHDRRGWPFYTLWVGTILLGIVLFATAQAFES